VLNVWLTIFLTSLSHVHWHELCQDDTVAFLAPLRLHTQVRLLQCMQQPWQLWGKALQYKGGTHHDALLFCAQLPFVMHASLICKSITCAKAHTDVGCRDHLHLELCMPQLWQAAESPVMTKGITISPLKLRTLFPDCWGELAHKSCDCTPHKCVKRTRI
jgi:hypothetical protein